MRRVFVVLVSVVALIGTAIPASGSGDPVPAPSAEAPADGPDEPASIPSHRSGVALEDARLADPARLQPPCDNPPCEPTQTVSAGYGGYVPVSPARIASLHRMGPGVVGVRVAGEAGVPDADVGAVVLNLTASAVVARSSITVWPAGAARPRVANLVVDATRDWTTVVVVRPGRDGSVTVRSTAGRLDLDVDVLGWFPVGAELFVVGPRRIYDSPRLGRDVDVEVRVTGVAGVPRRGVAAVVLNVGSTSASDTSDVTVWPAGEPMPRAPSLVTEPGSHRSNVVVVAPGRRGTICLNNEQGRAGLVVDVVAWLPSRGSYHPVTPAEVLDTRNDRPLRRGEAVDVRIAGRAGTPDDEDASTTGTAYAVVLDLTASAARGGASAISVYPAGDVAPRVVNVAGPGGQTTVALTMAELGTRGKVTILNRGAPADLVVRVKGWFEAPAVATQLAVPESTVIPDVDDVRSIDPDGSIVLAPGAPPVDPDGHVVLGITPQTPQGYLGAVTRVTTNADGSQHVDTDPARLEDVFPEGDIGVDLEASDYTIDDLAVTQAVGGDGRVLTGVRATNPRGGVAVNFEFEGTATSRCDLRGLTAYLRPLFDMQFRVRWRWFRAPLVTALATIGTEAGVALDSLEASCGIEVDIMKATVTFTAGPVPVVVVFALGATFDLAAGLTGVDIGAEASAGITVGARDNRGYSDGWAEFEYTPFDQLAIQARNLSAYAMVDAWLDFSVLLYGIIGPTISVGPFYEMSFTTNPEMPWWYFDVGMAAKIALTLDLWFHSWDWDLWEGEIPLADLASAIGILDDCTSYGPGFPGSGWDGVCRTPAPRARPNGDVRAFANRFRIASSGEPLATLEIAPMSLPQGVVEQVYPAQQFRATGLFSSTAVWRTKSGVPGLTLDPHTGVLSGTPTDVGIFRLVVEAWYGPVDASATSPPYGPFPPPRAEFMVAVNDPRGCSAFVTDAGDDGSDGQLRHEIADVCDGGTVFVPVHMEVSLELGELVVPAGKSVTVDGGHMGESGALVSIDVETGIVDRVVRVNAGAQLTLLGIGLEGGSTAGDGGGVWVGPGGSLVLERWASIRSSAAERGGGVFLASNAGGADPATLFVSGSSTIGDNVAPGAGGGVYSSSGTIVVDASVISSNTSGGDGGGIFADGGSVTLGGSDYPYGSIVGNEAGGSGGGVAAVHGASMTLNDSSGIGANTATGGGGGVFVSAGSVILNHISQVRGNTSGANGGGIAIGAGGGTVTVGAGASIAENGAGSGFVGGGIYWLGGSLVVFGDVSGNTPDDFHPVFPPT